MTGLRKCLIVGVVVLGVVAALASEAASAAAGSRSRYLAGYQVTDPDHVSGVIIKAVDVPAPDCSKPRFEGVALGGGSEPTMGAVEYFAGVDVMCTSGQAQYLMEAVVGGKQVATGIEPGDQAQIVITLHCDTFPTCTVFASATSLDTSTEVHVEATIDVTTDTATFGAFPLFREDGSRAPVPDFGKARILGCLFDNHLIDQSAERVVRGGPGRVSIKPTRVRVGSFTLHT